jgi:hypothetical protein
MKVKIMYELADKLSGKIKKASKTFSNFVKGISDEGLKAFVRAYTSLMDVEKEVAMKIVTSELA